MMDKSFNDLIKYCLKNGVEFSEMDQKTKDKLIKEICLRMLKLECESKELEKVII